MKSSATSSDMQGYADLHIHSCYAMASSRQMLPKNILVACRVKGISILGSGDALHPAWEAAWAPFLENDYGITVVPTAEVEDRARVHHLMIGEDFEVFNALREALAPQSRDVHSAGRPHVKLWGEEIARLTHAAGGLIGPAHAFTPWTSLYAAYSSLQECYGTERVDLLELGLSADSSYGEAIPDLYEVPFLTNSDAHSPDSERIGREYSVLDCTRPDARSVVSAVRDGRILSNVGFFPEEGKYNRTACTRCFHQFSYDDAVKYRWRCPDDRGLIKKGVRDRARELASGAVRPRPPYIPMVPLGTVIRYILGTSSSRTKRCQALYYQFIETFGTEIEALTMTPVEELREVDSRVADAVGALRRGEVSLCSGGGGKYGTFTLPGQSMGPV
ncbi:MAG: endonuclease Q family protein [Methanomicrobiales archaeon]|nr:endonuclease Q family protein [Methanomicrobiales archaeon]